MLVVGSYNLQNKFKLKKYNGKVNNQDNVILLKEFLKDYSIDILGTQEFVYWYLERAKKEISDEYSVNGKYRYPLIVLKRYDETNSIISRKTVKSCTTKHLPTFPNIIPRILTTSYIENKEFGVIAFYNTHLSVKNDKVKKKQLDFILNKVRLEKVPVILTGDFNMTITNNLLKNFIEKLDEIGLKRVKVLERTYKTHSKNKAIDHIFISKKMHINKFKVIKDEKFDNFSDHYPIVVWLERVK